MPSYLFVYGTLKHDSKAHLATLLRTHAAYIGPATFQGKLYLIGTYPGAMPSQVETHHVHGDVFEIPDDGILALLDAYEECDDGFAEPTEFKRVEEHVRLAGGDVVRAWIYIYNRAVTHLRLLEQGIFDAAAS